MSRPGWQAVEIHRYRQSLGELYQLVRVPEHDRPDAVNAAISRFLVVRTCGYLEQAVDLSIRAYIESKSHPTVSAYGHSWLGSGMNPSPDKLLRLVRRFSAEWENELKHLLDDDDEFLKREISFLVNRRNLIAHGQSETVGAVKSMALHDAALRVAQWFIERFDPT